MNDETPVVGTSPPPMTELNLKDTLYVGGVRYAESFFQQVVNQYLSSNVCRIQFISWKFRVGSGFVFNLNSNGFFLSKWIKTKENVNLLEEKITAWDMVKFSPNPDWNSYAYQNKKNLIWIPVNITNGFGAYRQLLFLFNIPLDSELGFLSK